MSIKFKRIHHTKLILGTDHDGNMYAKLKFRRQYYGEIQCGMCGNDLKEGFYWLNIGSCTPYCDNCVVGGI